MRNKLYRPIGFFYRECDAFSEYLHQQSLKGWHFREFRFGMLFEKGEPEDRYYSVEIFPDNKEEDLRPEANTQEYAEYCHFAGWKFIDSFRKFCVFERVLEDAVPIVTEEEKLNAVWKAEKRNWMYRYLVLIPVLCLWSLLMFRLNPSQWMFQNSILLVLSGLAAFFGLSVWRGISLLFWYFRSKASFDRREFVSYGKKRRSLHPGDLFICVPMVVGTITFFVNPDYMHQGMPTFIVLICTILLNLYILFSRPNRKNSRKIRFGGAAAIFAIGMILIIIYAFSPSSHEGKASPPPEQFPLLPSDLIPVGDEAEPAIYNYTENFLGSMEECKIWYQKSAGSTLAYNINYTICRSPYDWVLSSIWKHPPILIPDIPLEWEDCSDDWPGAEARRAQAGDVTLYWVLYDETILKLQTDFPLKPEQIAAVESKLFSVSFPKK